MPLAVTAVGVQPTIIGCLTTTGSVQLNAMTDLPSAKKSLGQHWLRDQASLTAIADAAHINKGDRVLEIGPGQGSLTATLLQRGAQVVAVELDERLATDLRKRFKG